MKTRVNFNDEGEVTQIKVTVSRDPVAYAEMKDGGAHITTVYPFEACEGISVTQVTEIVECLKALPFVEYAVLDYQP